MLKQEEKFYMVDLCNICQLNFFGTRNADLFFLKDLMNSFPFHLIGLLMGRKQEGKKKDILFWHFPNEIIQVFNQTFHF